REHRGHSANKIWKHGCPHCGRGRLSRVDGWQTYGDFRIQKLAAGAIGALRATVNGHGCREETAGEQWQVMERRASRPVRRDAAHYETRQAAPLHRSLA